jgi:3-oxoacyl-[acyl-carrier-protein] synthase III
VLFGDGAGAVVLKGPACPAASWRRRAPDGSGGDLPDLPGLYSQSRAHYRVEFFHNGHPKNTVDMDGRQVYRFATGVIASSIQDVLKMAR